MPKAFEKPPLCRLFQAENILTNHLDEPARTTKDYQEPAIAPRVAAALEDALRDEDAIEIDAAILSGSGFWAPTPPATARSSLKTPKSG